MDKINNSLTIQRMKLLEFFQKKEQLQADLTSTNDSINQLVGSIAALEYVLTLGLTEPTTV